MKKLLTSLFLMLSLALPVAAQGSDPFGPPPGGSGGNESEDSTSAIFVSADSIKAGDSFQVAIKLSHPPKWHSYYHFDAIGISKPPVVKWSLPQGFTASDLVFPSPHAGDFFGKVSYNYEGVNYFTATITAPDNLKAGKVYTFTADVKWQLCKESCKDEEASLDFAVDGADKTVINPAYAKELGDYEKNYIPETSLPKGWTVSATEKDNQITLTLKSDKPLPSNVSFFEYDGQVDAQKIIATKVEGNTLTVGSTRNQGNDFSDEPGPLLENLRTTIHFEEIPEGQTRKTFFINTKLKGATKSAGGDSSAQENDAGTSEKSTKKEDLASTSFTEEQYAEMAKLYKADKPIDLITLSDINDEGEIINDGKKVKAQDGLMLILLFAFVGGMILNLMPCVFPVLGVKVLGFVQLSGNDPKKIKLHGLVFALGMVISMWVLATVLLTIRDTAGKDINWGDQMGQPVFVGIMIIALMLFGLNLYGVFEIGTSLTSAGGDLQSKKGYQGSFFSGVLTTLIATPCSGPFLGATMGYTLQQSIPIALLIFTIFALGIAFPYVLLAFFPKLIDKLPRPGAWMVTFKKAMAFPMFATVAFLMMSYIKQTGVEGTIWMIWALVVFATAAFIYGTWGVPFMTAKKRYTIGYGLALGFVALGVWITSVSMGHRGETKAHEGWASWKPGMVEYQRSKKRVVWVDYTADW